MGWAQASSPPLGGEEASRATVLFPVLPDFTDHSVVSYLSTRETMSLRHSWQGSEGGPLMPRTMKSVCGLGAFVVPAASPQQCQSSLAPRDLL